MNDLTAVELRRRAVQQEFDARQSATERNRLGQFATPNELAIDIARYVDEVAAGSLDSIRLAEPSIGTGSFLSAALRVFGPTRIRSAFGVEFDPALCAAARDLWRNHDAEVICGDFTRLREVTSRLASSNLILANPPYVRHHHLSREAKLELRGTVYERTGISVSGLAGLYVYFILLGTAGMEEGGYAAWLVPSEFMDVNYGAALRQFLSEHVTLLRVHRFDPAEAQFDDALVSSVILVLRRTVPSPDHAVRFTFGGSLSAPAAEAAISTTELRNARKWTAFPQHAGNDRASISSGDGPTLGDFFRVQRGIATGSNQFFILERTRARSLGIPEECLKPILPSPRYLSATTIDAADDGYPLLETQLCVIDCDRSEVVVEQRYPALWRYLKTGESAGIRGGYLVSKRNPWYRQERRLPAPFLCTYMGRGTHDDRPFRFILNRSKAIATNLYLMLYPGEALNRLLAEEPDTARALLEVLQDITGHELRGEGRVYGGGLNKIEPRELARISATPLLRRWPQLTPHRTRQHHLFI